MSDELEYPRQLTGTERSMIEPLLPEDRPGYRRYLQYLDELFVIGEGRWGSGDLILGESNDTPEIAGPMEKVFASGFIYTDSGKASVTIHEYDGSQMEINIAVMSGETLPDDLRILKTETYSVWTPGTSCPFCLGSVREVAITDVPDAVIVFCIRDRLIWLYEQASGVNYPIPVTNYYNELMLYKHIKDPAIALKSQNLFTMLDEHSDEDLKEAYLRYNKTWRRIDIDGKVGNSGRPKEGVAQKLSTFFKGKKRDG
jgi:hypothetical protein